MMILKQKKIKQENEDTTTRRNPGSTSVIYLTAIKVAQHIQVDDNRREMEELKKLTAKKKPQERSISDSRDLKLLIGASTS